MLSAWAMAQSDLRLSRVTRSYDEAQKSLEALSTGVFMVSICPASGQKTSLKGIPHDEAHSTFAVPY